MDEGKLERLQRIVRESGPIGAFIRLLVRGISWTGHKLADVSDRLLLRLPMSVLTSGANREKLKRNGQLKKKHAGERCFIIGTAPSLNAIDLRPLTTEKTITVNRSFQIESLQGLSPSYHVLVDRMFADASYQASMNSLRGYLGQHKTTLITSLELEDTLVESWTEVERFALRQIQISTPWDKSGQSLPVDLTNGVPGFTSVVHMAIVSALYMGFKEVVLLGVDMDYVTHVRKPFGHAYQEDENSTVLEDFDMNQAEVLDWVAKEFHAFHKLGETAAERGAQIINASPAGMLDVYARKSLDEILAD